MKIKPKFIYNFFFLFPIFPTDRDIFSLLSSSTSGRRSPSSKSSERPLHERRFISSILGGDIPYGAVGHVLTQAQRKAYPSIALKRDREQSSRESQPKLVKEKEILPTEEPISLKALTQSPPKSPSPEPVVRCSVIRRVPAAATESNDDKTDDKVHKETDVKLPAATIEHQTHSEPEQDQPIDYHIPKRKDEDRVDEKEMKYRIIKRTSAIISRPIYSIWNVPNAVNDMGKINGIMSAAAGHNRQSSSSQGQQQNGNGNGGNTGSGGSSYGSNNSAGASSSNGGGGLSGSNGSNGGRDGRDGRDHRSNYGPNSPPTGSLPPFYESLKSGNGAMNAYNAANANFLAQNGYNGMMASSLNMDCDTTQDFPSNFSTDTNASKQFSMLHNAGYGIVLKDEIDLDYEAKPDTGMNVNGSNMMHNGYNNYDVGENMMVDMNNGSVDPLQFTATLTFSSPAEHALLDSLSDAVDLSSFLQRLPNDDQSSPNGNDLEISSTPSLTPDSVSVTAADNNNCLETFPDLILNRGNNYDRSAYNLHNNNRFNENPPSYQQSREMQHLIQQQQQQQQHMHGNHQHHHTHHHEQLSINYDIDSHSNMSLPSPSSGSMDAPPDAKPIIQSVSGRVDSSLASETKQRVSNSNVDEIRFW